jgi:DNA-3-methyladenine glycosylase II
MTETDPPDRPASGSPASEALDRLRRADPVIGRLIDEHPGFDPRAWLAQLPPMDAFGVLVFQVAGQQLSVASTRAILLRLEERFGGQLPSPRELLAADPADLRRAGFSARKVETLRELARRFDDGRLSAAALTQMSDDQVEAELTRVPGIGRWTADGFLLVALQRPDVMLSGDLALRRAIRRAYELDHVPSEDEVREIAERWRPYRSVAVGYLFASEYEPPQA